MTRSRSFSTVSTLSLVCGLQLMATTATAQCVVSSGTGTGNTPNSGDTVECRGGLDPQGISNDAATGVTVEFFGDGSGVATRDNNQPGVLLGANADVNVTNDNRVNTRGNDSNGVDVGDESNVNVGGSVTTRGDNSTAIVVGNNSTVTVTNDSEASAEGAGANAIRTGTGATLTLGGLSSTTGMAGDAVVVGANSSVQVNGTVDTQAMDANALVVNGGTNINVGGGSSGTGVVSSAAQSAILLRGSGNAIDVQSNGLVEGNRNAPTIATADGATSTDILVRAGGTISAGEGVAISLSGTDNEVTVQGGTMATPTAGIITAEGGQAILGSDTGSDIVNVGGAIRGGTAMLPTVDLRGGNDTLNINDGGDIRGNGMPLGDGGAGTDTLNVQGSNTIMSSNYENFEQVNVGSGATFNVDDAQPNRSTTTSDGGTTNVQDGGSNQNTTADGGTVNVQDGGNSGNTTAQNGGTVNVQEGGSSNNTTADGGTVNVGSGGNSGNTTSTNGGRVNVAEGGSATVGEGSTSSGGTIDFADGSSLNFNAAETNGYSVPQVAALSGLTVGSGVTATVNNSAFLTAVASDGQVEISRDPDAFAGAALTSNQRSVGAALDGLADSGPFGDELVAGLLFSANEGDATLNALSGEIYAAQLQGVATGASAFGQTLRRTAGDPTAEMLTRSKTMIGGLSYWVGGLAQTSTFDATDDTLDTSSSYAGLMLGAEMEANRLGMGEGVVGLALAYGQIDTDIDDIESSSESDIWQIGAYSATRSGPLSIAAALTYGQLDTDVTRAFPGDLEGPVATSQADGEVLAFSAEAQYDLGDGGRIGGFSITPLATLDMVRVDIDGTQETGGEIFGLSTEDGSATSIVAGIGATMSQSYVSNGMIVTPEFRIVLEQNLSEDRFATQSLAFNGALDSGFDVTSPSVADTRLNVGAGVTLTRASGMEITARYDGSFAEDATSHTVGLMATLSF